MSPTIERGLLIEERRRRICELLREHGRVTVDALAARFGTSQVTIRADLSTLESAGALLRTHGGALNVEDTDQPVERVGDDDPPVAGDRDAGRLAHRRGGAPAVGKPRMRAGIHVGRPRKVKGDYFGVDVNIAARVADGAQGDELLLSDQALDAIGSDAVQVRPRERLSAKGVPDDFRVYAVTGT